MGGLDIHQNANNHYYRHLRGNVSGARCQEDLVAQYFRRLRRANLQQIPHIANKRCASKSCLPAYLRLSLLMKGEGIFLGGHSTTSAFRLRRKKRGSFRLKKKMPLSYLDYYYALGSRGQDFLDEELDNGLGTFSSMKTTQDEANDEPVLGEEKRGSFRLKKNQQNSRSVFPDKRASFRLKRILDNLDGTLIGSRPAGFIRHTFF